MRTLEMFFLFVRCLLPWPLLFLCALSVALASDGPRLLVQVEGLRGDAQGTVCASIYNRSETFLKSDKAIRSLCVDAKKPLLMFDALPAGSYAVAVLHDENRNGKLDTNFLGIPKEGIGVSNNPKSRFGPPSYSDAQFQISKEDITMKIVMTYLF